MAVEFEITPFVGLANKLLDPYTSKIERPKRLNHYTSSQGLHGIISNHALWFSDNAFMNDGSEFQYGLSGFEAVLAVFMKEKSEADKAMGRKLHALVAAQKSYYRHLIFCMSDDGNLLNQWRDYGKDETAYSIEFDAAALIDKSFVFNVGLLSLIYDPKVQSKLVAAFLDEAYAIAKAAKPENEDAEKNLFASASAELTFLLSHFKNPAFAAEGVAVDGIRKGR